jgi:ribosomal protein S5
LELLEDRLCPSGSPVITLNPVNLAVDGGQQATFTATATGSPTPRVQWQISRDGGTTFHNVPFATTDTLTFLANRTLNGDEFEAVFTNSLGTATTTAATLTVDFGPVITTQPQSQTVAVNTPVTLTAAANSNPVASVQWQVFSQGHFQDIAGATSTSYTFTPTTTGVEAYRAVFTNTLLNGKQHSATTQVARVHAEIPPTVVTNPVSQTVDAGQQVAFTATASGTPAPRVHWQVSTDGGQTFHNIPFANLDTLTFTARAGENGDEFQAVFTNGAGQVTTSAATLTVDFGPVLIQPQRQVVAVNSTITITASATGNPLPTVQWFKSTDHGQTFNPIPGATSYTLTDTAPSSPTVLEYYAVFTSTLANGQTKSVQSETAFVRVEVPPSVTLNPTDQTVDAGQEVTFAATASGTPAPRVQWQVSTDGGKTFQNVPFATLDTLSFVARRGMNGDEYQAVFTNGAGKATTTAATLTVDYAPVITTQPQDQFAATGSTITLTAAANSNPAATVQWFKSTDHGQTFNPIPGATSPTLTDPAPSSPGLVEYYAVFTNTLLDGTHHTRTAVALVRVEAPPVVTNNPISQTVSAGQEVTFTATATGTALRVHWRVSRDGGKTWHAIPLANLDTLTFTAKPGQNGDEFEAVFTNPVGQAITSVATLTVT